MHQDGPAEAGHPVTQYMTQPSNSRVLGERQQKLAAGDDRPAEMFVSGR
jgi:hypothetical protein